MLNLYCRLQYFLRFVQESHTVPFSRWVTESPRTSMVFPGAYKQDVSVLGLDLVGDPNDVPDLVEEFGNRVAELRQAGLCSFNRAMKMLLESCWIELGMHPTEIDETQEVNWSLHYEKVRVVGGHFLHEIAE